MASAGAGAALRSPPAQVEIIGQFTAFAAVPTSQPTKRQKFAQVRLRRSAIAEQSQIYDYTPLIPVLGKTECGSVFVVAENADAITSRCGLADT